MPPARPGGTPSAVTVFLPYKSAVTVRTLRIRQRVQRAGLDAPARPGGTPSAVTVFLPYKSTVTAETSRDREQSRARYPRPPGWHPPMQ